MVLKDLTDLKILYLGNKINKKILSNLSNYRDVFFYNKEFQSLDYVKFDWIVSYGYRFIISSEHLSSIRPGFGLHPKYFSKLIGKKFNNNCSTGTRMTPNKIIK